MINPLFRASCPAFAPYTKLVAHWNSKDRSDWVSSYADLSLLDAKPKFIGFVV